MHSLTCPRARLVVAVGLLFVGYLHSCSCLKPCSPISPLVRPVGWFLIAFYALDFLKKILVHQFFFFFFNIACSHHRCKPLLSKEKKKKNVPPPFHQTNNIHQVLLHIAVTFILSKRLLAVTKYHYQRLLKCRHAEILFFSSNIRSNNTFLDIHFRRIFGTWKFQGIWH